MSEPLRAIEQRIDGSFPSPHLTSRKRTFENARGSRVVATEQPDGSWLMEWQSSMSKVESVAYPDADAVERWACGRGAAASYHEVIAFPSPQRIRVLNDATFDALAFKIPRWRELVAGTGVGPEDAEWRSEFFGLFGVSYAEWEEACRVRGYEIDPPPIRIDVVARCVTAIDAIVSEE